jgi:hypothetical protein
MELDDIHGSSDIYKIVHNVVFMSPYYEEYQDDKKLYPTLIYTPKGRYGASKTRIGIKTFDGWSQSYLPGFETAQKRYKNGSVVILRDTDREKIIASNPF